MKDNDAELIRLTLDGDESAFTDLVKKYEKTVQVLVWQKIGDFHTAEINKLFDTAFWGPFVVKPPTASRLGLVLHSS